MDDDWGYPLVSEHLITSQLFSAWDIIGGILHIQWYHSLWDVRYPMSKDVDRFRNEYNSISHNELTCLRPLAHWNDRPLHNTSTSFSSVWQRRIILWRACFFASSSSSVFFGFPALLSGSCSFCGFCGGCVALPCFTYLSFYLATHPSIHLTT